MVIYESYKTSRGTEAQYCRDVLYFLYIEGGENNCSLDWDMLPKWYGTIVSLQGRWPSSLHRWEVVRMKYDFKDLMAFGMFIVALLTFIFVNCK
jgi:hypothetical protein